MREPTSIRRAVLAGALALSLVGMAAGSDGAQAMPASASLAAPAAADGGALIDVQYMRYPHYRYRSFNRHRRAGLYRCGPGGLSTHLARKACR